MVVFIVPLLVDLKDTDSRFACLWKSRQLGQTCFNVRQKEDKRKRTKEHPPSLCVYWMLHKMRGYLTSLVGWLSVFGVLDVGSFKDLVDI